jgi:DNA processing protein
MDSFVEQDFTSSQLARLALLTIPGVGRKTINRIEKNCIHEKKQLIEVWNHLERLGLQFGLSEVQYIAGLEQRKSFNFQEYRANLAKKRISVLFIEDKVYPELLRKIPDPPMCLFWRGKLDALSDPPVAIVGTRKATGYGRLVTETLSTQLTEMGVCIVSGCMMGIDGIAHQVALAQKGRTVGVLGYGFDHVYPSRMAPLLKEMEESGQLLLSEYPPDTRPSKGTFPERNRIVAGLSLATLIPEAAEPSGSFITARCCLDSGRPVCAVPGPITSIYSEGTKALINQGAVLVTSAQEVWEQIEEHHLLEIWQKGVPIRHDTVSVKRKNSRGKSLPPTDPSQLFLYTELRSQPLSFNDLLGRSSLSLTQVLTSLTMLEMDGLVRKEGDLWHVKSL